jgi:hypothetical protein
MKIDEVCNSKTQCVVQMGHNRGFGAGEVDPKLAKAADAKDDEAYDYEGGLSDKDWDTYNSAKHKAYKAKDGGSVWRAHQAGKQQVARQNVRKI